MSFPSAAAFLLAQSAKNRVRRLVKQPRHLVFLLAGAAYFGMIGAAHSFARPAHTPTVDPTTMAPWIAPFLLLYLAGVWIFGADIAALGFSEPEVDFFFTAPVTRRALVHYRLVRTILGALITGVFFAVILRRGGRPVFAAVGLGLGLATIALHRICASMTRASLLAHGVSALKRRAITLMVLAAVVVGVAVSIERTATVELSSFDPADPAAWMAGTETWAKAHAEALSWLLFPIVALARVTMATTAAQFFSALPVALGVLAVHYAWAVSTDVAFEEASAEAARKLAHRIEAMRDGRLGSVPRTPPLFRLTAVGPPWVALFWKNLVAGLRLPRAQLVVWLLAFFVFPFATAFFGPRGTRSSIGPIALGIAVMFSMIGPHMMRNDLRQDMDRIDVLRSYPMRPQELVLGALLAPMAMITVLVWCLLGAVAGVGLAQGHTPLAFVAAAAALPLAGATACMLVLRNLGALLLPSLATSSTEAVRGIEAFGQRIVFLFGSIIGLAVMLVPAGCAAFGVGILLKGIGPSSWIAGGIAAAIVAFGEAAAGVYVTGIAFERFEVGDS